MAIKDSEPTTTMDLDPPEYSAGIGDYSPISAHFEGLQNPDIPSPEFLTNHPPQPFPGESLLSHRRSMLFDPITAPPTTKTFTYDVQRGGRTWAELKVTADELISTRTPTFIEGSRIRGQVSLYAARAEAIHSVVVSVCHDIFILARRALY